MGLAQMGAVTNRRLRPNYIDAINAQTPYLPQIYQKKEDTAYRDKVYGQQERSMGINERGLALSEKGLAQSADIARRGELLTLDQLDEQKKQNKRAQNLGWANVGLGTATGLANLYQGAKPMIDSIKPESAWIIAPVDETYESKKGILV